MEKININGKAKVSDIRQITYHNILDKVTGGKYGKTIITDSP